MIKDYIVKDLENVEKLPTRDGMGHALVKLGKEDDKVVVLCCDLAESTRTNWFQEKFPDRFIECGVQEQNMAGVAAGMALEGYTPFIASYATFSPGRNWDQVRVSICYSNANVKLIASHGGVTVGPDGATHQALEDIAILRVLPRMTVVVPTDSIEAEKATIAIAKHKGPCSIRLTREKVPVITTADTPFELGKAYIARDGDDVAIIANGPETYHALKAAEELAKEGISATVLNVHTVKPLDKEAILEASKRCGCVVTAEEHQRMGGFGSAVAELLIEENPVPMKIVGVKDRFGESGKPDELLEAFGLTSKYIVQAAKEVMQKKSA